MARRTRENSENEEQEVKRYAPNAKTEALTKVRTLHLSDGSTVVIYTNSNRFRKPKGVKSRGQATE